MKLVIENGLKMTEIMQRTADNTKFVKVLAVFCNFKK